MTDPPGSIRVGFDAGALAFPAGGVRRYVRELYSALPAAASEAAVRLEFVGVGAPSSDALPPSTCRGPGVLPLPTNLARAAVSVPLAVRRARVDLFHAPAYTAPLFGCTPVVLTIHDVSYARRPDFYPHGSGPMRQWFYRRSAWSAVRIITDSDFSRREIVAAYGIPASRIVAVPLGVGAAFRPAEPDGRAPPGGIGPASSLGTRLPAGVRAPFFLHVGDLHARRNLEVAARAVLRAIHGHVHPDPQLVCAGTDRGSAASLRAVFEAAGRPDGLCLTGSVSEPELLALYQGATALVYPSMYEGFGLPVLEAMACGLPVVAARAGSLPEVLGSTGILVRPDDEGGFADALGLLLERPDRRAELRDSGIRRAAEFTWSRTARATLSVFLACLVHSGTTGEVERCER
ncbi:MAG: glycosyltransferase family 1 protein [Acidobacteriota bacterium]